MFWRFLNRLPSPAYSILCILVVLYLTLDPDPVDTHDFELFEGADKVVHAIMMLGVCLCLVFDRIRSGRRYLYATPPVSASWLMGAATVIFGGAIEIAQMVMGLGRGGDWYDFLADAVGAAVGSGLSILLWRPVRRALMR